MDFLGHAIKKFGMKDLDGFHLPDATSVSRCVKDGESSASSFAGRLGKRESDWLR